VSRNPLSSQAAFVATLLTTSALWLSMVPIRTLASEPWLDYPDETDEPQVLYVKLRRFRNEYWFQMKLLHDDTGWNHFLDKVIAVDERNRPVFTRFLEKPTPGGWPFTVESHSLHVPVGVSKLVFKAHCRIHGYGTRWVEVDLEKDKGTDFEIVPDEIKHISRSANVVKYFRKESHYAIDWYW